MHLIPSVSGELIYQTKFKLGTKNSKLFRFLIRVITSFSVEVVVEKVLVRIVVPKVIRGRRRRGVGA